jgi:thioredoxin 1
LSDHRPYAPDALSVADIEQLTGPVVIDFGTDWCEHCQAARQLVETAMHRTPHIQHLKFEDGKGRVTGRAFKVKLWPTLIFLRDGVEVTRLVRPQSTEDIDQALRLIA